MGAVVHAAATSTTNPCFRPGSTLVEPPVRFLQQMDLFHAELVNTRPSPASTSNPSTFMF